MKYIFSLILSALSIYSYAQGDSINNNIPSFTLADCIQYGLQHQPYIKQSQIGVSIARTNNAINLAGWLPQVNATGNALHYFTLPTTLASAGDSAASTTTTTTTTSTTAIPVHTGVRNTFIPELTVSQTILNPQLLYAAKSARLYVKEAQQIQDSNVIFTYTIVSKAFYNLLLTLEQITVLKEDTARLDRNVADTYHQFEGGIVDETDYDEALISLNNSNAQLKQQIENIVPEYAQLKQAMGYPPGEQFNVSFDTAQMIQDINYDTTRVMQFENRIEYKELQTAKQLQRQLTGYYSLAFLPTISAFYNYYYEFENNDFSNLYNNAYPYSYIGLTLNIPIFTGFARTNNIHKSRLQQQLIDWQEVSLKNEIYSQYAVALANYKGNLYNWKIQKDNEAKAKNVYRIVSLQYKQGIVAYLNMIVAESNLISAEINEVNALFNLLSSKIDLEKAMGDIPTNIPTH